MDIHKYPNTYDTSCDIAYSIVLAMGGTMNNIQQIFDRSLDDILYAILQLSGTGGGGGGGTPQVKRISHTCNGTEGNSISFPALIGIDVSTIISFQRSGASASDILTAGNPVYNLDVDYQEATGTFTVDARSPFYGGGNPEKITIIYFSGSVPPVKRISHVCNGTEGNAVSFPALIGIDITRIISFQRSGASASDIVTAGNPVYNLDVDYQGATGTFTTDARSPFQGGGNPEKLTVLYF